MQLRRVRVARGHDRELHQALEGAVRTQQLKLDLARVNRGRATENACVGRAKSTSPRRVEHRRVGRNHVTRGDLRSIVKPRVAAQPNHDVGRIAPLHPLGEREPWEKRPCVSLHQPAIQKPTERRAERVFGEARIDSIRFGQREQRQRVVRTRWRRAAR